MHSINAHLNHQLAASEARETSTAKLAAARVAQMLSLRNIVKNMPVLAKALTGSRSRPLRIVLDVGAGDIIVDWMRAKRLFDVDDL